MKSRKLLIAMLALTLTLVMTLCLTGCGKKEQPAEDQSTQTQTEEPVTDETAAPAEETTATDQSDSEYIGEDKALEIALADAGLSSDQVSNSFAKLDYDDDTGRYEYEVKFYEGTTEYEYDVDAITGDITDKDVDFD